MKVTDRGFSPFIGAGTEQRFIAAFDDYKSKSNIPYWFAGISQASVLLDMQGVDFIALVMYEGSKVPVRVPIQVKSSTEWVKKYYEKHPRSEKAKVVVLVITYRATPEYIRQLLFNQLGLLRKEGRRYDRFLAKLNRRKIKSASSKARFDSIVEQRRLNQTQDYSRYLTDHYSQPPEPESKPETFLNRLASLVSKFFTSPTRLF